MDNWYQTEQQSNTEAKRIRLEQVFYFRVGVINEAPEAPKSRNSWGKNTPFDSRLIADKSQMVFNQ